MVLNNITVGLCEMSAAFFALSCKKGYDSRQFIEKLMHSDLAVHLYHSEFTDIWLGEAYLMETLEQEVSLEKGTVFSDNFMEWTGYLFKVWSLTYPEDTPAEMLRQAPVDVLLGSYTGLHVLSFEMAIENLKERAGAAGSALR